jgi:DNA-directed RNA polymerase subunit M/transcription elongation factor TFIIS
MTIKFCPTCERMQIIATKNNSQYLVCKTCKTIEPRDTEEQIIETQKIKKSKRGKGAAEKDLSGHDFKCKKCKNDKCKVIDLGMMFGDEDWVYLLQCTKCDYAERVGDWC